MTTATALSIDREVIERFIVEVDALATFNSIVHGQNETWLGQHIYRILDEFENATGLKAMTDEESEELHGRGIERGREVWREFVAQMEPSDA